MRDFIYRAAQFPIDEMDDDNYLIGGPSDSQREHKKKALKRLVNTCKLKTRQSAINAYYLMYSKGWELSFNQSLISDFFNKKFIEKINSNEIFKIDENTRISQLIHYHNTSDANTGIEWQENNNDLVNDTLYNIYEHGISVNNLYCLLNTIIQRIVKNYSILLLEFPQNPVMRNADGTREGLIGRDDLVQTASSVAADGTVWIKRMANDWSSPLFGGMVERFEIHNVFPLSQYLENKNVPIGGEIRIKEEDTEPLQIVAKLISSGFILTPLHYIQTEFRHYFEPVPEIVIIKRHNAKKWHLMQFIECEGIWLKMMRSLGIIQEVDDESDEDAIIEDDEAPDTAPRYSVHQRNRNPKRSRGLDFDDGSEPAILPVPSSTDEASSSTAQ